MRVAAVRPALTRTDRWLIGRVPALTVWLGPSVRTGIASSVSRSAEVPGFMTFTVLVSAVLGALMALLPDTSYTELPGLLIGLRQSPSSTRPEAWRPSWPMSPPTCSAAASSTIRTSRSRFPSCTTSRRALLRTWS